MENRKGLIPSLFVQNKGEESTKLALRLTQAKTKVVVRFTGGCGFMQAQDAQGLYQLFVEAFEGFSGALLFGGSRMVRRADHSLVVPGITEVPPLIRFHNPDCIILGVVPKSEELSLELGLGMVVAQNLGKDYLTIINPDQDLCLVVQQSVDHEVSWDAEFEECIRITENLREYAGWQSLLVSYNGGSVTRKEIMQTAQLGWPVLLIQDSGRVSEELSKDEGFLRTYPNVMTSRKESGHIRKSLQQLRVLPPDRLQLVKRA